jgi:hypothetical protein
LGQTRGDDSCPAELPKGGRILPLVG